MLRYFESVILLIAAVVLGTRALADVPATAPSIDRAALVDEIKTDQDAIKSITSEIAGFDKDAAAAETLAQNPPATIADGDKAAYIDQKKNEAQTAQDSAKEARERLKKAQKSLDDAKAKLKLLDVDGKKTT